jgi:hypothetical protein
LLTKLFFAPRIAAVVGGTAADAARRQQEPDRRCMNVEHQTRGMFMQESSIALINVWLGPLPVWMPAFLLSCRHNPDVEWIVFSEAAPPPNLPPNVRFTPMSIDTLNRRCTAALGFDVRIHPETAYKVVDLRPMSGLIFEKELHAFDFWGHCDLDVVWGDIRAFMSPDIMTRHDIITSRRGRISGHFCLFRNRPEWSTLFREIPDLQRLVQDTKHRNIDEKHLTELLKRYPSNRLVRFLRGWATGRAQPRVYWQANLTTNGAHQRLLLANPALGLRWCDGKAYDSTGKEMMYLHFHKMKQAMRTIDFSFEDAPREFKINSRGIFAS